MNGLSISFALLSLAGLPQEKVVYVPGWHRCARGEDEALRFVAAAFPGAEVSAWDWDGNCAWRKARGNADAAAERLADELTALSAEERGRLTLVGHSLGGRIVVRALARLGRRGMKVQNAVVMAAAIPSDDADIADFVAATVEPAEIVCNGMDTMLRFGYRPFGGEKTAALGAVGVAAPLANCRLSFVAPETVASAPVAGLWARVGWFRSLAAHYAPFYLEHVRQSGSSKNLVETPVAVLTTEHTETRIRGTPKAARKRHSDAPLTYVRLPCADVFEWSDWRLKCAKPLSSALSVPHKGAFLCFPWFEFLLKTPKSQQSADERSM